MALSLHHTKGGGDPAASAGLAIPDGTAALNAAEWLSLAAAADGSAGKSAAPDAKRTVPTGHAVFAADWLSLTAAPTFALMALLTAGSPDMICMTTPDAFPLTGMTSMYLLMSGFHLAPWLRLVAGWRSRRQPA